MAPTQLVQSSPFAPLIPRDQTDPTAIPQAPSAGSFWGPSASDNDGFSPAAIIGIVASIVIILTLIPVMAVLLRQHQQKRCMEMLPDSASVRLGSSHSSVREGQSLKSIMVTREVQRESVQVDLQVEIKRPEEVYEHQRGWSRTEVRGGDGR